MALNSRYSEISELQQLLKTKSLELAYAKSVSQTHEVIQQEDARLLRVRIIILEHENDELHEQLAEEDARAAGLERRLEDVQTQRIEATSLVTSLRDALRSKSREAETLEAELASLNVTSTKITKLLTEKLVLEHELASLKPEIERLRSQVASYQSAPETIGNPEAGTRKGRVAATQRDKRVSTMPGDKSNFSITPFLNRTASVAPDSPSNKQPDEQTEEVVAPAQEQEAEPATKTNATPSAAPKKKRTKKPAGATTNKPSEKGVLSSTIAGKENRKASKAKKAPVLSQVVEENEENERPEHSKESTHEAGSTEKPSKSMTTDSVVGEETSRIKKKRKLLGGGANKTLFDDEEGESARPLGKGLFGGGKGFPVLMSRGLGGTKGHTGPAAFSPLKKDKKAAAAK